MKCLQCGTEFKVEQQTEAAISIFVMGDEYSYSYWSCDQCGYYTVKSYRDQFCGEEEVSYLQPVTKEVGDRCVELIRACPNPHDKYCECDSHKSLYFGLPG